MISNDMLNNPNNRYFNVANSVLNEIMELGDDVELRQDEIENDYGHRAKSNPKAADYLLNQDITNLVNDGMKSIKNIMHTYQPIADEEWFDETDAEMNKHDDK